MKRSLKSLFVYGLVLFLVGCFTSEEKDTTAPKIKEITPDGLVSITDTVEILFDEDLDTGSFSLESDSEDFTWEFKSRKKLHIYGTKKDFGQFHFPVNSNIQATLLGIQDTEGNEADEVTLDIEFHPWADYDFIDREYLFADSLIKSGTTETWMNGKNLNRTLVTEGAIQGELGVNKYDFSDYKILFLQPEDTLSFKVKCETDVDMEVSVVGPFVIEGFEDKLIATENSVGNDIDNIEGLTIFTGNTGNNGELSGKVLVKFSHHANADYGIEGASPGIYLIRFRNTESVGFYQLETTVDKF